MVRIAYYASIHHFPQSEKWARQAFTVSSDLPGSWNKTALQKNALVALAATQPMDALHLLGTLAAPESNATGAKIPEDVRADAARTIFESAYRKGGKESLLPMLEVSDYLGRTGEYPYGAWGIVLPKIEKSHPATFKEVISTAIRFYGDGEARTRSHDEEYFDMVNEIRAVANRSQMQLAVSAAIERLQAESPPKDETYFAVVGHGTQKSGFNDPSKELLYQWLPLVKEFDSADYEDLAKKLNAAGSSARNSQEGSVEVLTNPKNMTPKLQQWAQDHLQAEAVENDASSNPDLAIRESAGIYSMALRSDALSRGAMTVPSKKMPQRRKLLAEAKRDLDMTHTKDRDYLQAIADLADAYSKSKMQQSALALVHDGLEQGTEVLEESADAQPNTVTMALGGYNSLAKLVKIGMKIDPTFTLKHVQNLRDLPLKVNLLVDIADALAAQQSV